MKLDSEQTKKTLSVWYFAAALNFSLRNSKPGLWPCHTLCYFPLATYRKCQTDKSQNPEQRVPCLSTDLEIWWPWTFEDDADFDALFCFMQLQVWMCHCLNIQLTTGRSSTPSKKELVTIERGDINQRSPILHATESRNEATFFRVLHLQFQNTRIQFPLVQLGHYADCCTVMDSEASL